MGRRKLHRIRKPWGYPKDLSRPYERGDPVHFAAVCSCGWRVWKLSTFEEAERLAGEHAETTGHEPDPYTRKDRS